MSAVGLVAAKSREAEVSVNVGPSAYATNRREVVSLALEYVKYDAENAVRERARVCAMSLARAWCICYIYYREQFRLRNNDFRTSLLA